MKKSEEEMMQEMTDRAPPAKFFVKFLDKHQEKINAMPKKDREEFIDDLRQLVQDVMLSVANAFIANVIAGSKGDKNDQPEK